MRVLPSLPSLCPSFPPFRSLSSFLFLSHLARTLNVSLRRCQEHARAHARTHAHAHTSMTTTHDESRLGTRHVTHDSRRISRTRTPTNTGQSRCGSGRDARLLKGRACDAAIAESPGTHERRRYDHHDDGETQPPFSSRNTAHWTSPSGLETFGGFSTWAMDGSAVTQERDSWALIARPVTDNIIGIRRSDDNSRRTDKIQIFNQRQR
jgi:hypothetical protein